MWSDCYRSKYNKHLCVKKRNSEKMQFDEEKQIYSLRCLKEKKKELFLAQEDFNTKVSSWKNRAEILKTVGAIRASQNKDTKEGFDQISINL